ncbi:CMD domain-containing protein [Variovorax boronicumulans]|uniref:CMD domain-containing protein n=1 Tax=Variovorax boronicumulans TaxID=436515 RepID=UPI003395F077
MTNPSVALPAIDVVDDAVSLASNQPTWTLRRQRDKVVAATQSSHDAMFSQEVEGLSRTERLLVALHACRVSKAPGLAAHYREALAAENADALVADAVERGDIASLADARLRAMLGFAGKLIERPIEGDRAAIEALAAHGLSTPALVALAQLIAFLSYQVRVVAGLKALAAAEVSA